jgi:CRP-like cAMP-binding protein
MGNGVSKTPGAHRVPRKYRALAMDTLRGLPFFAHLSQDAVNVLASSFYVVRYEEGDMIIAQGDTSRDLFIVAEGSVEVVASMGETKGALPSALSLAAGVPRSRSTPDPKLGRSHSLRAAVGSLNERGERILAVERKGAWFGIMGFMRDAQPRTAAVRARESPLVLQLQYLDYVAYKHKEHFSVMHDMLDGMSRDFLATKMRSGTCACSVSFLVSVVRPHPTPCFLL